MTCLWALRRRRTSCLPYRSGSGRRSSGPGFKSSLAPLTSRGEERGRRGGRGGRLGPPPAPLVAARRRQRQWHSSFAGFPGDDSPRAVFLRLRQAQMRCIMAGLDQKDSCVMAGFTGYDAPRAVFLSVAIPQVQFLRRLSCPLCATTNALVQTRSSLASSQVQLLDKVLVPTVEIPQVQFLDMVICPLSSQTVEEPQIQLIAWFWYTFCATETGTHSANCAVSCCCSSTRSSTSPSQCRLFHMVQTVCRTIEISQLLHGDLRPCCAGRAGSQVPAVRRQSCLHSCSSSRNPCLFLDKVVACLLVCNDRCLFFSKVVIIPGRHAEVDSHGLTDH